MSYELDNMRIESIILPDADWIGFLGYRVADDYQTESEQWFEIFAQANLDKCIFELQAVKGSLITEISVKGSDTIAIGREDGTVTVLTLLN